VRLRACAPRACHTGSKHRHNVTGHGPLLCRACCSFSSRGGGGLAACGDRSSAQPPRPPAAAFLLQCLSGGEHQLLSLPAAGPLWWAGCVLQTTLIVLQVGLQYNSACYDRTGEGHNKRAVKGTTACPQCPLVVGCSRPCMQAASQCLWQLGLGRCGWVALPVQLWSSSPESVPLCAHVRLGHLCLQSCSSRRRLVHGSLDLCICAGLGVAQCSGSCVGSAAHQGLSARNGALHDSWEL
jgi:hypothetical protein